MKTKNKKMIMVCYQCKHCVVENTAILDCADKNCRCHKLEEELEIPPKG